MARDISTIQRNDEIYRRFKKGESIDDLAKKYGMSGRDVRALCKYRRKQDSYYSSQAYLKKYIKEKRLILKQLAIGLKESEIEHLNSLKSEAAIDSYVHDLIMKS